MFIHSFIHSIQVLRENSFTAKFLLIKLKRTNYQKYQSKWVCGCYNTRKAWAMVLWNEVANAIQIWPKMWFHNKFTQDNKAVIHWSSTITLTCLQCKCCAITTAKTKNSTNLKVKVERKNNKWKRYRMEKKFLISALAIWIYIYILCILFLKDWLREW